MSPVTLDQRRANLAIAQAVRGERTVLKRELLTMPDRHSAQARVAYLLAAPPEFLLGMDVVELLGACRGVGPSRVRRVLVAAQVHGLRKVRDLTDRSRRALIDVLGGVA